VPCAAEARRQPAAGALLPLDAVDRRGARQAQDRLTQRSQRQRLVDEHRDAERLQRLLRQSLDAARGDQDRHFRKRRPQLLGELNARHVGQIVVEQGNARRVAAGLGEPGGAVMRRRHRQAGAGQEGSHLLALDAFVLDDQDIAGEIVGHCVSPGAWAEGSSLHAPASRAESPWFVSTVERPRRRTGPGRGKARKFAN
jgi:hypothetical protein